MDLTADVTLSMHGDRTAYARVVRKTMRLVSTIALSHVNDLAASEDIAQDVFVQAWSGLRKLRGADSFLPWLRQLTRNRAQDFVRNRFRRHKIGALDGDEVLSNVVDSRQGALDQAVDVERDRAVFTALEAMPDDAREVLTLFYREGQSVSQVAELLELSEVAVKKRLSRARLSLKDELERTMGELFDKTSPGDGFHAAVLALLPAAAPTVGASAGVATATSIATKLTLANLAVMVAGPVVGVIGLSIGHRMNTARALDDHERRELTTLRNRGLVLIVGFGVLCMGASLAGQPLIIGAGGVAYVALFTALWVLPYRRIKARKHAQLVNADPTLATKLARRRRRQDLWALTGICLGLGSVCVALWLLFFS